MSLKFNGDEQKVNRSRSNSFNVNCTFQLSNNWINNEFLTENSVSIRGDLRVVQCCVNKKEGSLVGREYTWSKLEQMEVYIGAILSAVLYRPFLCDGNLFTYFWLSFFFFLILVGYFIWRKISWNIFQIDEIIPALNFSCNGCVCVSHKSIKI